MFWNPKLNILNMALRRMERYLLIPVIFSMKGQTGK
jgi:hypothetical protein